SGKPLSNLQRVIYRYQPMGLKIGEDEIFGPAQGSAAQTPTFTLGLSGVWQLKVIVRRVGLDDVMATTQVTIAPAPGAAPRPPVPTVASPQPTSPSSAAPTTTLPPSATSASVPTATALAPSPSPTPAASAQSSSPVGNPALVAGAAALVLVAIAGVL